MDDGTCKSPRKQLGEQLDAAMKADTEEELLPDPQAMGMRYVRERHDILIYAGDFNWTGTEEMKTRPNEGEELSDVKVHGFPTTWDIEVNRILGATNMVAPHRDENHGVHRDWGKRGWTRLDDIVACGRGADATLARHHEKMLAESPEVPSHCSTVSRCTLQAKISRTGHGAPGHHGDGTV